MPLVQEVFVERGKVKMSLLKVVKICDASQGGAMFHRSLSCMLSSCND